MNESRIISEIASQLGVTETNREKWFVRGYVPHKWRLPILQKAAERGLVIDPATFDDFQRVAA